MLFKNDLCCGDLGKNGRSIPKVFLDIRERIRCRETRIQTPYYTINFLNNRKTSVIFVFSFIFEDFFFNVIVHV